MRENCKYGLMRGNRPSCHGRFYTGTKLETVDTAKDRPNDDTPVLSAQERVKYWSAVLKRLIRAAIQLFWIDSYQALAILRLVNKVAIVWTL